MHSHLSQSLAHYRSTDLRRAADRARVAAAIDDGDKPRHSERIVRVRCQLARLTARIASTGS